MLPELIMQALEKCVMIEKKRIPDGQGGTTTEYVEGAEFEAAIKKDSTLEAVKAEREGVTEVYTVVTRVGVGLDFGETFKRLEDGKLFRVKSNAADSKTPRAATFAFERVRAEGWEIPK